MVIKLRMCFCDTLKFDYMVSLYIIKLKSLLYKACNTMIILLTIKVEETKHCYWAHIRRHLLEAIPKGFEKDYSNPALQGGYCNKLFEYERSYSKKELSYRQIHTRLLKETLLTK